ncbi:HD-GYP domain-containing protein [Bacillus daqingensis]|uniref:HD-GYP domain-containing protein n=1 Tax=Bacillus daqingensis TaxID=872396 RepID=A0ABV9NSX8_9BACI
MRYTPLEHAGSGEKLARDIFAVDGRVLLSKGVTLTIGLISKLRDMGVTGVYMEDSRFADIPQEELVSETTKRNVMEILAASGPLLSGSTIQEFRGLSETVENLIDEITANKDVLASITDIRSADNELFLHMLNVAMISVLIGIHMKLEREKLKELAVGALLHDVGKVEPSCLAAERDKDTAGKQTHHAWKGFHLLRKAAGVSTLSAHVALAHHEHPDGSGMPRGLFSKDIHLLAKIVACANMFDRLHTSGVLPHTACEQMMALSGSHLDHAVVWRFMRAVAFYPNGTQVRLSTGATGIIIRQHAGLPQRPVIRLLEKSGSDFSYSEIDLAEETTLFIEKVFA